VYLPLLVGRARALEIIASSEDYDADTAERYGWINRAIPDAELDDFVDRADRCPIRLWRPAKVSYIYAYYPFSAPKY
jgi:enoyl-CoA hydratase/carnithine racemase